MNRAELDFGFRYHLFKSIDLNCDAILPPPLPSFLLYCWERHIKGLLNRTTYHYRWEVSLSVYMQWQKAKLLYPFGKWVKQNLLLFRLVLYLDWVFWKCCWVDLDGSFSLFS